MNTVNEQNIQSSAQPEAKKHNLLRDIYLKFFIFVVAGLGVFEIVALIIALDYWTIQSRVIMLLITTTLYGLVTFAVIGRKQVKFTSFEITFLFTILIGYILTVLYNLGLFEKKSSSNYYYSSYNETFLSASYTILLYIYFAMAIGLVFLLLYFTLKIKAKNHIANTSKVITAIFTVVTYSLFSIWIVSQYSFDDIYYRLNGACAIAAITAFFVTLLSNRLHPNQALVAKIGAGEPINAPVQTAPVTTTSTAQPVQQPIQQPVQYPAAPEAGQVATAPVTNQSL